MDTEALTSGTGRLFTDPDPEKARAHFRTKSRALVDKVTTVREAVARLVHDGDYVAVGGFGGVRIPTAVLHEIVRQGRVHLGLSGHTATHDFQILTAGRCFDRCDIAYVVGLEARGLSPNARRYLESGAVEMVEWSNYSLALRYKAAAMGVPFLPLRANLGTDTFRYGAGKVIECPFTGMKLMAAPALYPDVGIVHVHECDPYGNCRIKGIQIADMEMARASKHVIVTCEHLVSNEEIRRDPALTAIPYWCVDAVIEVPFGSYPGNMAYEYFSDEDHIREWLAAERDEETLAAFVKRNIHDVSCFEEYLERNGGIARLNELRRQEHLVVASGPGAGGR